MREVWKKEKEKDEKKATVNRWSTNRKTGDKLLLITQNAMVTAAAVAYY